MTTRIRVDEGEDAPITLQFRRRAVDGTMVPLVLTGVQEIELIVKNKLSDTDVADKFTYTKTGNQVVVTKDGSAIGAEYSEITVNIQGSDQTPPANYYYKVIKTLNGKKETIAKGVWTVENT